MIAYLGRIVKHSKAHFYNLYSQIFDLANIFEGNLTKFYLILANIVLVSFAIWFSNVGLLPFKNISDFAFFSILALILALYRPGWTFLFFVGTLALESINLVPESVGISLRPYQFFGFITIIALAVQLFSNRLAFSLPKFKWQDSLLVVFVIGGFLSAFGSINKGVSLKQSLIALSFVALYFLTRIYVQSFEDLKKLALFFLSSGVVVSLYAIWQNFRFITGANSFEVMPGRPNATFTEADWLGIYLVFLLSIILTIIFYQSKKTIIFNFQPALPAGRFSIFNKFSISQFINYIFLVLIFTTLILTVSRSAWVGAVFVTLVFLKFILLGEYAEINSGVKSRWQRFFAIFKLNLWRWREAGLQMLFIAASFGIALLISIPLTRFEIGNRAMSTGGLQKITISCNQESTNIPNVINNVLELEKYGCKHINLEEIEKEKNIGKKILEISRPDPNVNIRAQIYAKSWQQIKEHPALGLGWGTISTILGNDERGAGLNASNVFLEVWLGSGFIGFLAFVILLGYIVFSSIKLFVFGVNKKANLITVVFLMLGWTVIVFPNLFNSGIFLGFVWAFLGVAVSLLAKK